MNEVIRSTSIGRVRLSLKIGDIVLEVVDAIVNAANSGLMGGGGVDGAIHGAGGPEILRECREIVAVRGRLAPGGAVMTHGGNMKAHFVIHTVGPVWHGGGRGERDVLTSAYRESLRVAREAGLKNVSFPSISTGAYGYPVGQAANVALGVVIDSIGAGVGSVVEVNFVLLNRTTLDAYADAFDRLTEGSS